MSKYKWESTSARTEKLKIYMFANHYKIWFLIELMTAKAFVAFVY